MTRHLRPRRPAALLLAFATVVLALAGMIAGGPRAYAAGGDRIDSFDIRYTVRPDGSLDVTETVDYRFGSSGRHGIDRTLITRERYDDEQDAVYTISNIRVSSPTGAPTLYRVSTGDNGSDASQRIRIGDPNRTVGAAETYVISYRVTGAMRSFADYDEFFWDATGFEIQAPIRELSISAAVPGGAREVSCFVGAAGSKTPCETGTIASDRTAQFTQSNLAAGEGVSIGVKIASGQVSNPHPDLQPSAAAQGRQAVLLAAGTTGASAIIAPLLGLAYWRRMGRDDRYLDLAPGTTPVRGAPVRVGPSPRLNLPVAFSPPRIPVGEAGLLIDGSVDPEDFTATLIDLAVRGAVTIAEDPHGGRESYQVVLRDPQAAQAPHETVLLTALFRGSGPGAVASLDGRGSVTVAHDQVVRSLRNQVARRGWFHRIPGGSGARLAGGGFWVLVAGFWFVSSFGASLVSLAPLLLPLLPVIITIAVVKGKMRRGRRTAEGRAVCDQIEGFKTYLATAEADQLRFEEGEDIFSKYLPWAIMFGLAERWAKLCEELVAAGRIPDYAPTWYYGHWSFYNMIYLDNAIGTAALPAAPAPTVGSSGSGWGGGSSFGGGGFSGGGGGGGGMGSW